MSWLAIVIPCFVNLLVYIIVVTILVLAELCLLRVLFVGGAIPAFCDG